MSELPSHLLPLEILEPSGVVPLLRDRVLAGHSPLPASQPEVRITMAGIPSLSGTTQEGQAPLVTAVLRQLGFDSGRPTCRQRLIRPRGENKASK